MGSHLFLGFSGVLHMGNGWIVRRGTKETPPIAHDKLIELAKAGKLRPDDMVRREDQQEWQEARKVKGLFDGSAIVGKPASPPAMKPAVSAPPAPTLRATADPMVVVERIHQPAPIVVESARPMVIPSEPRTKPCPFCSEPVLADAKKCKHCGEIIDVALRAAEEAKRMQEMSRYAPPAAQPSQAVNQVVNVNVGVGQPVKRWSPIVAGLLSLIIPGLGQIYKGQPLNGIVWFILVVAGYFFLIVPGLILHLCCILGAMMGNPYK